MKSTRNSAATNTTVEATGRSLRVPSTTVPHPVDSQVKGDRQLVMIWHPTGKSYPKMEAHWVYADKV